MRQARCKSCGAMIVWAFTARGKLIPLDADPVDPTGPGRFVKEGEGIRKYEPLLDAGKPAYVSHFSTCEHAELHRGTATTTRRRRVDKRQQKRYS